MNTTLPASDSRRAASSRAAPTNIAVWASWPHACIAPATSDANGRPVSSAIGSASMSARSRMVGPGRAPASRATTDVVRWPVRTSSGRPSRASSTVAWVRGSARPSSGCRWIRRRSWIVSSRIARASSRIAGGFMERDYRPVYALAETPAPTTEDTVELRRSLLMITLAIATTIALSPRAFAQPAADAPVTIAVHVSLAPTWFDPAETPGVITPFLTRYALHDALVKPMSGNAFAPSLAESWTASKDGLSYEFVLAADAREGDVRADVEPALLTGVGPRLAELPTITGHPYISPYEDLKLKGR